MSADKAAIKTGAPVSVYTVGRQPCSDFLRGDADVMALGDGNRRNCHQCPECEGRRAFCDNCNTDHHEHGWESCKPGAYVDADLERPEWIGDKLTARVL